MKKQKNLKVGDYLFRYIGDASPIRYKPNDVLFVNKYQIIDIKESRTLMIKQIPSDTEINKSVTRWWYSELDRDYEIQETA